MVTRKPLPSSAQDALGPLSSNPPYPTTPTATDAPPAFRVQDVRNELQSPTDSQPTTPDGWGGDGILVDGAVNHNSGKAETSSEIPESLRPGKGPPGYTPKSSRENLTNNPATSNNPFLKQQQHPGGYDGRESSAQAWGSAEDPAGPSTAHPPLPVFTETPPTPLSHQFSNLSVSEQSTNPWQPALDEKASTQNLPDIPSVQLQDSGDNAWTAPPPERKAPAIPESLTSNEHPVIVDAEEDDSPAWDEDESVYELPTTQTEESQQLREDQHAWDGQNGSPKKQAIAFDQPLSPVDAVQQADGWNIVEHETLPQTSQQSGIIGADGAEIEIISNQEHAPALPPRTSEEQPPPQPPRPMVDTSTSTSTEPSAAAIAIANAQKKETYDIKKITWHDVNAERNPRISPILVQNANGPCPLLALVNALTLSTPAGMNTALVETLQSREQVSLGLLIEAVFDELMSGRRGDAAQELPDVSDLYSFLLALHTGMNVNPTFIPPAPPAKELRKSMSHVHPSERVDSVPGTFEETREMKLYSTFSIPLIHGWLPEKDSPAYVALARSAKTYEDAQNIMFREEELEDKLQREGLNFEEQATLEDIATIKAFLSTAATQLTQHGLNTITTSLPPAGVAILFRNDHFSTLYRHPETLQLLQLVTDMGYAGHEEVVWESLIDVNGENADFFSGDFRLVGGAPASPVLSQSGQTSGWNTRVQGHQSQPSTGSSHQDPIPPTSPNTEQEDHDMALALQLQEEEEERHRSEIARRRRETELSQQYIEQQGAQSNSVPVSQRGGGSARGRNRGQSRPSQQNLRQPSQPRPAIPPRRAGAAGRPVDPEAGIDAPPPTYDEAATTPAYVPPPDHPSHPSADPNAPQRRTSAYSVSSPSQVQNPGRGGRVNTAGRGRGATLIDQIPGRRPSVPVQQQNQERDRDCLVM